MLSRFFLRVFIMVAALTTAVLSSSMLQSRTYGVRDGLPTPLVRASVQDSAGFLWIATDNGLVKYGSDGFETYKYDLRTNFIRHLAKDRNGRILALNDQGLFRIHNERDDTEYEQIVGGSTGLTHYSLYFPRHVYPDSRDNIWVSEAASVVRLVGDKINRYFFEEQYRTKDNRRGFLFAELTDRLLISSHSGHLFYYLYESNTIHRLSFPEEGSFSISALYRAPGPEGEILLGSSSGLYRVLYDDIHNDSVRLEKLHDLPQISDLEMDERGILFIGTWDRGLYLGRPDKGGNFEIQPFPDISMRVVNDISVFNGHVWVSGDNGLVFLWVPVFSVPELPLAEHSILHLSSDRNGHILYGDGNEIYLAKYADAEDAELPEYKQLYVNPLSDDIIQTISLQQDTLWVGYRYNRIHQIIDRRITGEWLLPELGSQLIRELQVGADGSIWVMQEGSSGLFRLERGDNEFRMYAESRGIESSIQSMHLTGTGEFYVGSESDSSYLYLFDPVLDRFRNISRSTEVLSELQRALGTSADSLSEQYDLPDLEGIIIFTMNSRGDTLLLGTNKGLLKQRGPEGVLLRYKGTENLIIRSITVDASGSIWMGTDRGALRYFKSNFLFYEENDGLPTLTLNINGSGLDNRGFPWFATPSGLAVWNADADYAPQTVRPVIARLAVDGRDVTSTLGVGQSFPHNSFLELSFYSLSFPRDVQQFQYRIFSRSEQWSELQQGNTLLLPKLHSGDFRLEIRVKQPDRLISEALTLDLQIRKPWYFSSWGIVLLVLIFWAAYELYRSITGELKEKRYLEQLQITLYKMSREAFIRQDVQNVYETIHNAFKQLASGDSFSVHNYDAETDEFNVGYSSGKEFGEQVSELNRLLIRKVLESKRSLLLKTDELRDFLHKNTEFPSTGELKSWVGVPLASENTLYGVLVVQSFSEDLQFGTRERDVLEFISSHVSQVLNRLAIENALEESERKLRSIIDAIPEFVVYKNAEGKIEISNQSFVEFVKAGSLSRLIGRDYRDLLKSAPPYLSAFLKRELESDEKVWSDRQIGRYEVIIDKSSDKSQALDITKVPLYGPDRSRRGMVTISHDVSGRKETELLLQDALETANIATKTKSEFIANMSHEIRTPLNGVIGMADLLLETSLGDVQKDYASVIKSSADFLLKIVNEILDFSKIEAGKMELEDIAFNLRETFDRIADINAFNFRKKGLESEYFLDPALPWDLIGDVTKLEHVFVNLIGNAIKFTEKGKVRISARADLVRDRSVTVLFEVADSGIGIPEEKLSTIFEEFTQADNSITRKFGGTGLGLAISSKLVELMGGKMRVESPNGLSSHAQGTSFIFRLNFRINEDAVKSSLQERKTAVVDDAPIIEGLRVLVVDDNRINQKVAGAILKKVSADVSYVDNGLEAVNFVKANEVDLILMDVYMPEMDGLEATRCIRRWEEEQQNGHVPIFGMTASVVKEDIDRCYASGMDLYLPKPIKINDFIKAYREYAGARS